MGLRLGVGRLSYADGVKPHPKIRKMVKWGGLVLTVLVVVVWVGSGWCDIRWVSASGACCMANCGYVEFAYEPEIFGSMVPVGWDTESHPFHWELRFQRVKLITGWTVAIPLWSVLVLALIPTGSAWRLDTLARRRARVGLCAMCNYDRAGLAAGAVCPECGAGALVSRG